MHANLPRSSSPASSSTTVSLSYMFMAKWCKGAAAHSGWWCCWWWVEGKTWTYPRSVLVVKIIINPNATALLCWPCTPCRIESPATDAHEQQRHVHRNQVASQPASKAIPSPLSPRELPHIRITVQNPINMFGCSRPGLGGRPSSSSLARCATYRV